MSAKFLISLLFVAEVLVGTITLPSFAAETYPSRPIRILTGGMGSSGDYASRVIGHALAGALGQQVFVDNRTSGIILGDIAAKAPSDGYTLLVTGPTLWLAPFMYDSMPWDPMRDFSPITLAVSSPNVLIVHPSLPVKSVKELIALAKAKPGELNYGAYCAY
jgi:tripartite-type tricarboxylate transporter receptor subunit TctC